MEPVASVTAVGEEGGDRREAVQGIGDDEGGAVAILNVRAMNLRR